MYGDPDSWKFVSGNRLGGQLVQTAGKSSFVLTKPHFIFNQQVKQNCDALKLFLSPKLLLQTTTCLELFKGLGLSFLEFLKP